MLNNTQYVMARLNNGANLTAATIVAETGSSNPAMIISMLEKAGAPIERTRNGRTMTYSLPKLIGNTDSVRCRLLAGEPLTNAQLSAEYGLGAPASIIFELRKRGMKIKTTRKTSAFGGSIAVYHM